MDTVGEHDKVVEVHDLSDGASDSSDGDEGADDSMQGDTEDDSVHCFTGHTGPVYAVAWNPRLPALVATGGGDDRAFLWQAGGSAEALDETKELRGHTDTVASLAFNHDGSLLASGGLDGQVRIWSSQDASCTHTLDGPSGGIEWLSWHPRGDVLVAGSEDFTAWMWNAASGAVMQVFTGHSGPVRCGQFTPDGKHVITGGGEGDESMKVWDPKSGACTLTVQESHSYHTAGLTALAVHPDCTTACSGSEDATARLVNLQTGRVVGALTGHTDSIEAISFVSQLPLIATCSVDGDLRIWETSTFAPRATCHHHEAVIRLICHPTRPVAYTGCLDGAVRSWDMRTGECLQVKRGHTQGIQDLAISHDGTLVISGSDDCTARIFELD